MPKLIPGPKRLGSLLQQWHSSMGDPIYAVGSHWYAGHPVPADVVRRAIDSLDSIQDTTATKLARMLEVVLEKGLAVPSYLDLSPEQQEAIMAFKRAHGRFWKDALNTLWMNSKPRAPELQQIRNDFGPSWLMKVKDWPKA